MPTLSVSIAASLAGAAGARASQLTEAMRGLWGKASGPSPSKLHAQQQRGKGDTAPMLWPQPVHNKQSRPQSAQNKEQQRPFKPPPASAGTQLVR